MIKITPKITELLFDISELEVTENVYFLHNEPANLRNNLLKLYRVTDNEASREKIIAIMSEAGYSWFAKLVGSSHSQVVESTHSGIPTLEMPIQQAANEEEFMSEEDFLDLLPANSHFH